ncbi:MAG: hypothetical protein IPG03_17475 [Candidatus Microthrix sp.]|nr:hypothetical protein [Candidatus Microthrix sp.]MBK6504071.1 hypothetical protein [Candidatus Microthrix sp.]
MGGGRATRSGQPAAGTGRGALPDDAQRVALGVLGSSSPEVGAPARQRLELLADAQRAVHCAC